MKALDLIEALGLPPEAIVDKRIPKSNMLEHARLSAADRRLITAEVDELRWEASLKDTTVAISAFSDDEHEYSEIVVLYARLRLQAKASRINLLIHRAVPYPVVLVSGHNGAATLSLATKRRSLNEANALVVEGEPTEATLTTDSNPAVQRPFLDALALSRHPRRTFRGLYERWIEAIEAFHAARITGTFELPSSPEYAASRRNALLQYARLEEELTHLRAQAASEKQMQRQIDLNDRIRHLKAEYANVCRRL